MNRVAFATLLFLAAAAFAQPAPGTLLPPISVAPIVPVEWRLLSQPAVRADIQLTAEQKKALEKLEKQQATPVGAISLGMFGWINVESTRAIQALARDNFFTKTLTKAQRTRLRQIEYQLKEREFGAYAALAMAAKDIGLRGDQLEDVTSIKGQRVEDIAKLVTSGERFEKVKTKVEATNGDTYEKMAEMLTRAQRERLKELKGAPFKMKEAVVDTIRKETQPPVVKFEQQSRSVYPPETFGLYDYELRYLMNEQYREALRVTKEQVSKIEKEVDTWNEDYTRVREKRAMLESVLGFHDRTAKSLASVLTTAQLEHFHQLMARRRIAIGGIEAACGYPPVVEKLKLSPIQLKYLKEGKKAAEVLSKAETEALNAFIGKPSVLQPDDFYDPISREINQANQRQKEIEEAMRRPFLAARSDFARYFLAISDRLKLSEDQIKKLRELAEDEPKFFELIRRELSFADTAPVTGAGRGVTPAGVVSEQFREAVEEQCWNVLDERQQSIAKQIYGRRK